MVRVVRYAPMPIMQPRTGGLIEDTRTRLEGQIDKAVQDRLVTPILIAVLGGVCVGLAVGVLVGMKVGR